MDDSPRAPEAPCIACQDNAMSPDTPQAFAPLRLLLQPGGLSLELAKPDMMIGRHSSADVRLCLPDVSRRHCRCVFADGRWKVIDLGSLNGTFVNDCRQQEAVLAQGDTVRIGSLTFCVDLQPAEGARADVLQSIADVLPEPELRRAS